MSTLVNSYGLTPPPPSWPAGTLLAAPRRARCHRSPGLYKRASEPELEAVLEHERYHNHNLDPLKVTLARALPATFFYLALLRDLHPRYLAGRELAADRRAVPRCGKQSLAGALFTVVRGPQWPEPRFDLAPPHSHHVLGLVALAASFVATVTLSGGSASVADATGMSLRPADIVLGLSCGISVAVLGWLAYRGLSRRARSG
jgi:hypothetical protein